MKKQKKSELKTAWIRLISSWPLRTSNNHICKCINKKYIPCIPLNWAIAPFPNKTSMNVPSVSARNSLTNWCLIFATFIKEFCRAMFCLLVVLIYLCVLVCKKGFLWRSSIERKGYCSSVIVFLYFNSNVCTLMCQINVHACLFPAKFVP